jgi:hypothetical protein
MDGTEPYVSGDVSTGAKPAVIRVAGSPASEAYGDVTRDSTSS